MMPRFRLLFLAFCLLVPAASSQATDPAAYAEHFVDAGHYTLYLRVYPGGEPTVLLEAGGGMDCNNWNELAPRLVAATGVTVVTYDRPGFGQSDLPDLPCDMREESQSLWRALAKLRLDHQVIAAGYSYGGWMTRLHANDHPGQVIGVVFIDPFNCPFVESFGVEYWDRHPMMGNLPFKNDDPATLTREQKGLVRMVGAGLGPKWEVMKETKVPAGIPVYLLSSRRPFLPREEEQKAWWAAHDKVVAGIPGAVLIEAAESDHGLPFQQPDLIIQAIGEVVKRTAARSR